MPVPVKERDDSVARGYPRLVGRQLVCAPHDSPGRVREKSVDCGDDARASTDGHLMELTCKDADELIARSPTPEVAAHGDGR
jgi:hypothetical protein